MLFVIHQHQNGGGDVSARLSVTLHSLAMALRGKGPYTDCSAAAA